MILVLGRRKEGSFQLNRELQDSLGYKRSCLKKKSRKKGKRMKGGREGRKNPKKPKKKKETGVSPRRPSLLQQQPVNTRGRRKTETQSKMCCLQGTCGDLEMQLQG